MPPARSCSVTEASRRSCRLADTRVVMTGRVGDTQPRQSPFIEFSEARGSVSAILAGAHGAQSPSEAADHLLAPILTHAFGG